MLVAALVATTIATAQATPRPTPQRFKLDGRSLTGQPKSICVIEGKWADGEHLRYESWDSCSKMHVRRVHQKDHKDAHPLGTEDHYSVKDIPRGSEVLEFNNSVSTVLVIRDANGSQREILSGD